MNVNEPVDYPGYERIDSIEDIRVEDIVFAKNGNRYTVVAIEPRGTDMVSYFKVRDRNLIDHWIKGPYDDPFATRTLNAAMYKHEFGYALRRKTSSPETRVPDQPGLWVDAHSDLWSFAMPVSEPFTLQGTCIRRNGLWLAKGLQNHIYTDMFASDYAPFRPYKPEDDHE